MNGGYVKVAAVILAVSLAMFPASIGVRELWGETAQYLAIPVCMGIGWIVGGLAARRWLS